MTVIPYILYLLLVAAHVVVLRDLTAVGTATLNLPALIVLIVALYKNDVKAAWFGFLAGLVMAAGDSPALLGWQALIMASVALAACSIRVRLNLDSFTAKLLFILSGVSVHNLAVLILSRADGFLIYLVTFVLAGAVYTTVAAWLFFLFKERRITWARVRALF